MFSLFVKRFRPASPVVKVASGQVSDATFKRKLETSDALRRMCGFDSELYQAITDLRTPSGLASRL